jgi:DNA mismatch repair protein MutS
MALIKEYFELTKKYQDDYGDNTILLMQVGSFFEVYGLKNTNTNIITGSRITDFSQICELNIADKNSSIGKDNVIMAGFKDIMIEKYLRKIQDAGFTVVVYTQDESVKNTTRSLQGIFSPGTYFADDSSNLTNNLTCIWIESINNKLIMKGKYIVVGISNIDIFTGKTSIFQFKEVYTNNPTNFDELERFISIYNPSEVIIVSNLSNKEVDDVINYTNIKCSSIFRINTNDEKTSNYMVRAKNCEKQSYQKEILNKFYKIDEYETFIQNFYENDIATRSFCFLLDFVYQHNPHLVRKINEPIFENCSGRLILANHSLKQLNIIDDNSYNGKYSSVLKMLNCCFTPMGRRSFQYQFLNPITNVDHLQREYNITEYILSKYDKYDEILRLRLSSIKDISKWGRQVILRKISPKSFYNLHNNILIIKEIYNLILQDTVIREYLNVFEKNINDIGIYCDNILSFIVDNIDIKLCSTIEQTQSFEINFINQGVDEDLDNKTKTLRESEEKLEAIRDYLNELIEIKEKKAGKTVEFVKIHETEKNNYSLVSTSRRCKILQEALPSNSSIRKLKTNSMEFDLKISKKQFEYEKQSASNNFIVDEQINDLCKNISTIKIAMKDTISIVYNKLVEQFEGYQPMMECVINFITLIDVIFSKSYIAKKYNYCKPKIVEANKSFINAKKLRHCLIEHLQNNELYVTNDVTLGNGLLDGVLLYGTNAVGKTSLIRALGISLIMAQSGLYVPSTEFTYKPYKYIFTRIIGNDNIFKGLSTFAVEMSELRTILRLADKDSLILGDELCSGTENTSAVSIFVAGIQKLHDLKSSFIFATHLHEIVDYDEIVNLDSVSLKHMTVIYDKEKDVLIYDRKLKDGPGNSMYGLEVCKSLSLPEDFLNAAYSIRAKYHPESGSLLSLKTSHYNTKKIVNLCEMCEKNMGTDVHHLQHQRDANIDGIIVTEDGPFHKNKISNLMTLCEKCHNDIHKTNVQHKRVKTTKGYQLQEM